MNTKTNTPLSAKKWFGILVGGFLLLCVVIAAVSPSKSKSTSPRPTSSAAPAVTTTSPASGGPGVTAEEAFNMDASCENVHPAEHAKCESLYAPKKLEEEGAAAAKVLKSRQAERTASQLEAISEASENE